VRHAQQDDAREDLGTTGGMMEEQMKSMSLEQQQKHMEMMQQQCR
jgi:hypothetical protein